MLINQLIIYVTNKLPVKAIAKIITAVAEKIEKIYLNKGKNLIFFISFSNKNYCLKIIHGGIVYAQKI
ncbi:MAG: hypothetical protein LC122_02950 [Chitinophagales bacterium]|nr:hypothetical protein [Chitinophagales bacterium]